MKVKNLFLIAAGVFMLTTTFTATAKKLPKEVKMTKEVLMDKIKGGWAGKTIGCSYGGPTEFKYSGFMNDEIEIPWHEHTINGGSTMFPGFTMMSIWTSLSWRCSRRKALTLRSSPSPTRSPMPHTRSGTPTSSDATTS